ncbi:tyrosinase family protein [Olivibacter sp. SDN3]|uniref:tyrosinase family protein n=1 Tax=Olivibacter sp. SDN3 TaxID=2764720 RepID=UPI0016518327|nr:tyrosinase family protein [Olivibacter sp. SDN3]QNL48657.1 tyrosinase family protein [Olivibacter sp. SDN3]
MNLEFAINNRTQGSFYAVYTPVSCTLRRRDGQPGAAPVPVLVRNQNTNQGGQFVFYTDLSAPPSDSFILQVPGDGSTVSFYIGGKPNAPSTNYNDAAIDFRNGGFSRLVVRFTIRIRKNANNLTVVERDKFLNAFVRVVQEGIYQQFLDMHNEAVSSEIHNRAAFLPWHRIYLLDLERHLQLFDRSVTIPYWDFQAPAPNVFSLDFMGIPASGSGGQLQFSPSNPLNNWYLENLPPLARVPRFNTQQDRALVEARATTLARQPGFNSFARMEGNPHGNSHTSFTGPINFAPTAPQDPLFFMLHANADRIWAEWQMLNPSNVLFDGTNLLAYNPSTMRSPNPRIGDYPDDTMWPWNGVTGNGRPDTAPGGPLIDSPFTNYPGPEPKVIDTIDYQGRITGKSLYFDYDHLPFDNTVPPPSPQRSGMATTAGALAVQEHQEANKRLSNAFRESETADELIRCLNHIDMLTEEDDITKAIAILKDTKLDAGLRALALNRLIEVVSLNEDLFIYVLKVLENQEEPSELRKEALRTIETCSFTSPIFPSLKPKIIQVFRGLTDDHDQEIRENGMSFLAKFKDEFLQRLLIEGLEVPQKALVPEEFAISLLGYDIHAGIYPLLQKIVRTTNNDNSRAAALYLLAGDPNAEKLLVETFLNKDERFDVRKNSLIALKQQSPEDFLEIALKTIADKDENENIRIICLNAVRQMTHIEKTKNRIFTQLQRINLQEVPTTLARELHTLLAQQASDENGENL